MYKRGRIAKSLSSQKGETLLEVVMSVALFALTMLTLASIFLAAMNISRDHYETELKADKLLSAAAKKESSTEVSQTITFELDAGRVAKADIALQKTQLPDTAAIYQFVFKNIVGP